MTNRNESGKAKYEAPIIVPLGTMAKGSGVCATGSSVVPAALCSPGAVDAPDCAAGVTDNANGGGGGGPIDCVAGPTATRDCTAGYSALRNCSAGTAALPACSGGTAATLACTGGTANVGHL